MTEFVERPKLGRNTASKYPVAELVQTAENGKAVVVPFNGVKPLTIRSTLAALLKQKGYYIHCHDNGDGTMIAWCEKRP